MYPHSCSSRLRSCASTRTAACRLKPSMSAHKGWCVARSRGIAPHRVNIFCPARGPKAIRKVTAVACSGRRVRASSRSASASTKVGSPSASQRYTPSRTRQCRWMLRFAAEPKRWISVTAPPWPSSAWSPVVGRIRPDLGPPVQRGAHQRFDLAAVHRLGSGPGQGHTAAEGEQPHGGQHRDAGVSRASWFQHIPAALSSALQLAAAGAGAGDPPRPMAEQMASECGVCPKVMTLWKVVAL